jgi:hypothetical protein
MAPDSSMDSKERVMKLKMHATVSRVRSAAISAAVAVTAAAPVISHADVPLVDGDGKPAIVLCKLGAGGEPIRAVHMDKVIFRITGALVAALDADQPALDAVPRDSRLDIKVLDDPRTVADLKGKVLTFLRAVDGPGNRANIVIDDVDYAVVCPNPDGADAG